MKKGTIITIAVVVIVLSVAAACFVGYLGFRYFSSVHDRMYREKPPAVEQIITDEKSREIVQKEEKESGIAEDSEYIGEERAKEIALAKAELSADEVTFIRVELDRDDGVWRYEVEFRNGRTEYEADIKAVDGTILNWDVDYDD